MPKIKKLNQEVLSQDFEKVDFDPNNLEEEKEKPKKRSAAIRKRIITGSATLKKVRIPKVTHILRRKKVEKVEGDEGFENSKSEDSEKKVRRRTTTKSRELVTRKGILGLNLVSKTDLNRQAALDDENIEQRGNRRYRVSDDGIKIKMKKISKRRLSKSSDRKLKKFIENDASLYPYFDLLNIETKADIINMIRQGIIRGFVTEDELLYLIPFPEDALEVLEDVLDLCEDSGAPLQFDKSLSSIWAELDDDDVMRQKEMELSMKLSGDLAGDISGEELKDDAVQNYIRDISRYKLLSKEEEVELSKRIEQ